MSTRPPLQIAIVGAGPAGFYAAQQLLSAGLDVDLFDALPTPFGLVRAGVAPDHPKIKSVVRIFERTAAHERFRFFGGVELGHDVRRDDLLARYHGVIYAVGTSSDNRLGIPGEHLSGSHPATEFVAWYNGHPAHAGRRFDLKVRRAVVVGNGNVAIDVARMLVLDPDELSATDAADHALAALAASEIEEVVVLGRRGPAQAAFTHPELRELGELRRADVLVDAGDLELDPASAAALASDGADPTARRNVELLRQYAVREPRGASHRIHLRFLRSPVALEGPGDGSVTALRVARNRMEPAGSGALRAVPTGEEELLECGLVLRSIGYRGHPLPGLPFDDRRGTIRNREGRVIDAEGRTLPGEYAVGWIKRGPSGVIGTNKKDAADTVARLLEDVEARRLNGPLEDADRHGIEAWLRERVAGLVTWGGWEAIDRREQADGATQGRPRVKLVRIPDMLDVAGVSPAAAGRA
jgi:ferredoxin--NADP+ reductase